MAEQVSNGVDKAGFSVEGKVAIVTGAGSGINLCFASLLLSRGCSVVIADLALRPAAQKLVDAYASAQAGKPRAVFCRTDVTEWAQLERMFSTAVSEFGDVDIVCPGAGIFEPRWGDFWNPPGAEGTRDSVHGDRFMTVDINIVHPIRTTQLAIQQFLNLGEGREKVGVRNQKRIIIVSSITGQIHTLLTPVYVASKHAMHGFVRSLASLDAQLGIRVNAVAPGLIKTPLWTEHPEKLTFVDPNKDEWATPEEVAEAMLRCLEDDDLGGGTILEVGARQTRKVEAFNDPGPSGPGHTVSNLREREEAVFEWLAEDKWSGQIKS